MCALFRAHGSRAFCTLYGCLIFFEEFLNHTCLYLDPLPAHSALGRWRSSMSRGGRASRAAAAAWSTSGRQRWRWRCTRACWSATRTLRPRPLLLSSRHTRRRRAPRRRRWGELAHEREGLPALLCIKDTAGIMKQAKAGHLKVNRRTAQGGCTYPPCFQHRVLFFQHLAPICL